MIITEPNTARRRVPMSSLRKTALIAGVVYLITFISIPTLALYGPVRDDPTYILGPGPDTPALIGAALEIIVALACIGTAVVLYPVVKRQNEAVAMGFVGARVLEAATIFAGVASLLSVVTLRQAGAGADALVAGQALVALHDWTMLLGQGFLPGVNALLLGSLLYRSRLVPRIIPLMGLVGAPLIIASWPPRCSDSRNSCQRCRTGRTPDRAVGVLPRRLPRRQRLQALTCHGGNGDKQHPAHLSGRRGLTIDAAPGPVYPHGDRAALPRSAKCQKGVQADHVLHALPLINNTPGPAPGPVSRPRPPAASRHRLNLVGGSHVSSRPRHALSHRCGCRLRSAVALLINAAKRAEVIPTSAFTQLVAPVAEILALALVTALYLGFGRRTGIFGLVAFLLNAFALSRAGRGGVRDQSRLQRPARRYRPGARGRPPRRRADHRSVLFLLGSLAFVAAMLRTREIPATPLVLYALGAVPVALRLVPEAALDLGLATLAVGTAWLAIWLFTTSHHIATSTMTGAPPAPRVAV